MRRRYERLTRFPDGLLVLRDLLCAGDVRPGSFLPAVTKVVDTPWETSTGGELAFPGVAGHRPAKAKLADAYLARLQYAATKDPAGPRNMTRRACPVDGSLCKGPQESLGRNQHF